ncbi:MAG: hypothetical protein EXS08_09795 [Planctomycetes bacterium]|nr:hypothetical protein [Planctomycetota bacterium]
MDRRWPGEQARDLFLEELALALESLASVSLTGRLCPIPGVRGVRRILLRKSRHHLYYRVARDAVTIVAVWSAVRGRGPSLAGLGGAEATPTPLSAPQGRLLGTASSTEPATVGRASRQARFNLP